MVLQTLTSSCCRCSLAKHAAGKRHQAECHREYPAQAERRFDDSLPVRCSFTCLQVVVQLLSILKACQFSCEGYTVFMEESHVLLVGGFVVEELQGMNSPLPPSSHMA